MTNYLVVGAELYGSTFTYFQTAKRENVVKVIEKREHVAGNIYTEELDEMQVHKYVTYIFHTKRKDFWIYVHQFVDFNRYINNFVASYNLNKVIMAALAAVKKNLRGNFR